MLEQQLQHVRAARRNVTTGLGALGLALGALAASAEEASCRASGGDHAWAAGALATWESVAAEDLSADERHLPLIVFFDARCVWRIGGEAPVGAAETQAVLSVGGREVVAFGTPHGGTVRLPDGGRLPVQVTSFAATTEGSDSRPFLVMALPSVWRAQPSHAAEPRLDLLMRAVFAHEMTQTLQTRGLGRRVSELEKLHELGAGLDDNIIQKRFGKRPAFAGAYGRERDLLFAAARARDAEHRRSLARGALTTMRARRAAAFTGIDAPYAELEDLFLNFEGSANWSAYRVVRRGGLDEEAAIDLVRRGGRRWSQDEGLALFLLFDTALPGWQRRVLSDDPAAVETLLAEVVFGAGSTRPSEARE